MIINKPSAKQLALAPLFMVAALGLSTAASASLVFSGGIPASWTCTGNCGTLGADGVVTLAPGSTTDYGWVSTAGGASGAGQLPGIGGTNGTTLTSNVFSANAGDLLDFYFNYVTSDGAGYADYAWAQLVDASSNVVILFTARTMPSGSIVPGTGLPPPNATLIPPSVPIIPGGPSWSPLDGSSGACWSTGCGYTDWVESQYTIATAGNYTLQFGVTNWADTLYDSGMAFDGITVGGNPITPAPEPTSLALLGIGLAGLRATARRRRV